MERTDCFLYCVYLYIFKVATWTYIQILKTGFAQQFYTYDVYLTINAEHDFDLFVCKSPLFESVVRSRNLWAYVIPTTSALKSKSLNESTMKNTIQPI